MIDDAQLLSRLLDGDLPPGEAERLRARIAREPALRDLWQTLQALPGELQALPALPEGAERPAPPRAEGRGRSWPWAAVLLAAGAAFVLGRATAPPAVIELQGARLHLRGTAAIHTPTPEEDSMNRSFLTGGLTVALISGTAWLASADGATTQLSSDAPDRSVDDPAIVRTERPPPVQPVSPVAPDEEARQRVLDRLRFENTLLRGALRRHEGDPQSFPEAYPAELSPEQFEQTVWPLIEEDPVLELQGTDCTEYPCVAWIEATGPSEARWEDTLHTLKGRFERREGWQDHWIWTFPHVQRDGVQSRAMVGIMVHPGAVPDEAATRLQHRVEITMEERISAWSEEP